MYVFIYKNIKNEMYQQMECLIYDWGYPDRAQKHNADYVC